MNVNNTDGHIFMPVVVVNQKLKKFSKKQNISIPIYAPFAFITEAQAEKYLGTFIKDLVASGDLPDNTITKTGDLNEDVVVGMVKEIILTELESEDEEVK